MRSATLDQLIANALREDAADRDITTRLLFPIRQMCHGFIVAKEDAVLCGLDITRKVFQQLDKKIHFQTTFKDGDKVRRNTKIALIEGNARAMLTGERTALNFLGHLSGIATGTRRYIQKIRGTKAVILDTRKTTPGLRTLEKYAVRCGGGVNHRSRLDQLVLIKDNHRAAYGPHWDTAGVIKRVRGKTKKKVEIEVDDLAQFKQALSAGADMILLDNMTNAQMKRAVKLVERLPRKKRPLLEASGGITLSNIAGVARTGVKRISIGALTHTHKAVNMSLQLRFQ